MLSDPHSDKQIIFHVTLDDDGQRLDKVIANHNESYSRTQIQSWIENGCVEVDGINKKGNYRVKEGERVEIQIPDVEELTVEAERIPLDIVFEDDDVIVINKPRGMVVHPGAGNHSGTLVNGLLYHCRESLSGIGGVARPGIVHRIDKDTSGLIMVAKNDIAHQSLVEQLKNHSVERQYQAIVHGVISHNEGTINAPIGRDQHHRQQMTVTEKNSRQAVTHFHVLERFTLFTFLQCQLETGRTHQIRVHMKYIGHPLLGDPVYGPKNKGMNISGQALHAKTLGFKHPRTGQSMRFEVDCPEDMRQILSILA